MQPSAFLHEIAEDVILKRAVVFFGWDSSGGVAQVNVFGLGTGGIAERRRAEIGDLKLHGDAASLRIVLEHLADELQIVGEGAWKFADIFLLHPAVQHFFLQGNEDADRKSVGVGKECRSRWSPY